MTTPDHSQDSELARGEERPSDADLPQETDAPREAARPTDEARPATEEHLAKEERSTPEGAPTRQRRASRKARPEQEEPTRQAPAQHSAPSARRFGLPMRAWRIIGVIGLVLSVCGVGAAWAVSSPLGASPDDDYHLGSIWCPPPLSESGCSTGYTDRGTFGPVVPESVSSTKVACYAFHGDESAVCALNNSDDRTMVTDRWDDGNYPWGYYQFHHHFIAHDADRAGVTMRVINVGIAIVLIGAIGALMPSAMRRGYVLAIPAAWTPMGIYFIASNNPSSWAFTGVFAFAAGLWAATQSLGWRRWCLIGAAALGAVLACTSRGDSAFFLFVVTAALAFAVRWRRDRWPEALLAVVSSIIGIIVMRSTNVASTHLATAEGEPRSLISLIGDNMSYLPQYLAGFYGYRWGPGWLDVDYNGSVSTVGLVIAGAVFVAGARTWSWRKAMTLLMLVGAMAGVPTLLGILQGFNNVATYQPRYMMPLWIVFLFFMLTMERRERTLSRPQAAAVGVLLVGTHFWALFVLLLRYTHGSSVLMFNMSKTAVWWWPGAPVGPNMVWALGTVCFAAAITFGLLLTREEVDEKPRTEAVEA